MDNARSLLLRDLILQKDWTGWATRCRQSPVQDVASALDGLELDLVTHAFSHLPKERWADVFSYLPELLQYPLLHSMQDERGRFILKNLSQDDRTALLESLEPVQVEHLLRLLSTSDLKRTLEQLGYPEESAGRLMTTAFITIRENWTLARALDHVRLHKDDYETIDTLYVTNQQRKLQGIINLKSLVLEPQDKTACQLVSGDPITIQASADRAEAVRLIQRYDLVSLPVLDTSGALLGVVTVDDVMDVAEEENTEDFHKLGGVSAVGLSLRDARPALLYRKRVGWLVLLVFMNIFSGMGIAYFEDTIAAVIALVFFLPLIIDSGGNAGSQAATLMVRALATGDVQMRDWFRLWAKELGVSAALGVTMGAAVWGLGLWRGGAEVALTVSLSMVAVVIVGSMVGMLLPFILTRMKIDPATASAPLITSIADISGILIYFSIATAVLTLPAV